MKTSEEIIIKKINETWNDGPCRRCECYGNNFSCSDQKCEHLNYMRDQGSYVLVEENISGECCPSFKRIACKDNGQIYQVLTVEHHFNPV